MSSLSPDVESGFKMAERDDIPAKRRKIRDVTPAVKREDDHDDDHDVMHSDTRRRPGVSALAIYGWFHRHSGYIFLLAEHPIPALMDAADTRFRAKLSRQSTSLAAAVVEYKRRYRRPPPAGFDKWYAFAKKAGFVMIDEFDAVVDDLEPFWSITGAELRRRAELVGALPSVDVVQVRGGRAKAVSGGKGFADSEVGARAKGFKAMLDACAKDLPNMDFTINAKAEGRVVVPWEHANHPNLTDPNPPFPSPDWAGTGSVWEAWRRTCPPSSPARRLYSSLATKNGATSTGSEFAFVRETGARSVDFCRNPGERYEQGHFFSDWRTYPLHVPIFSPARAQGFADIRIPSHYYYGGTRRYTYAWDPINLEQRVTDPMEMPWEQKRDAVWWRGASTGGGSSMRSSSSSSLATEGGFRTSRVPLGALNREVMDVAFVKEVVRIERGHRVGDSVELGVGWGYKYLLDLDGMGYSGRFMAFLASDSVPVKNTMYDEFFSGWIEPWVHYIPLSPTYSEVYNMVAYFSGPSSSVLQAAGLPPMHDPKKVRRRGMTPPAMVDPGRSVAAGEGDRRARRIARAGKQWKATMGRKVDMEVYVYRLALEYARLWADDREKMSYRG
ncbi:glycosyltransferase family 90 protein [Mycena amicta]|nr:glycosyltransferase family 90 protein [Mycena amicta]